MISTKKHKSTTQTLSNFEIVQKHIETNFLVETITGHNSCVNIDSESIALAYIDYIGRLSYDSELTSDSRDKCYKYLLKKYGQREWDNMIEVMDDKEAFDLSFYHLLNYTFIVNYECGARLLFTELDETFDFSSLTVESALEMTWKNQQYYGNIDINDSFMEDFGYLVFKWRDRYILAAGIPN